MVTHRSGRPRAARALLLLLASAALAARGVDQPVPVPRSGAERGAGRLEQATPTPSARYLEEGDPFEAHPTSEALEALEQWVAPRAWPGKSLPASAHADAWESFRRLPAERASSRGAWRPLGPTNTGGRTLAVAFNPQNPLTLFAGSAGGGLWRTRNGGVGPAAWTRIATGQPVTSVSCIALAPADSQTIYIGTGEVYAYQGAEGGVAVRTARGTYGIGILKSTNGGQSWVRSLDWSRQQQRGVWRIRLDPADPNRVWAATTEGVYLSTNGGGSWALSLNVLMATDLEIDPVNSQTLYAACGNFSSAGYGIYRTKNGGASWTRLTGGLPPTWGGKAELALAPSNTQTLYASLGNGSSNNAGTWLCRSDNGGDTWSIVATADYANYQGWYSHDVAVSPSDPSTVLAVGIDIWKSTAGGAGLAIVSDWAQMYLGAVPVGGPEGPPNYSHADHHQVVYHPTDPNVAYLATDGGIFRTRDGGATFEGCNGGYQTGQFYNGFSSAAADTVPAMGGLQDNTTLIYEGTPAWRRVIGGDGGWTAIDPTNSQRMIGSYQYLNLLRSLDGGLNFTELFIPAGGTAAFIAPFGISPIVPTTVFACRSSVFRSVDQGSTWAFRGGPGSVVISLALSWQNSGNLFVGTVPTGAGRSVYRSSNGGTSWTDLSATLPNRYPMDVALDPTDDRRVYVAFGGYGTGHLYRSVNSGLSWTNISGTLPDVPAGAVVVDPLHPDTIYLGNDLGVFVSFDGGAHWGGVSEGLPEGVFCTDLSIQPSRRRLRLATHGNGVYERPLFETVTAVSEIPPPAGALRLNGAPNPFQASTRLELTLAEPGRYRLDVVDPQGRHVRTLSEEQPLPAGTSAWTWDGRRGDGTPAAAGVYFARATGARGAGATWRVVRLR